MGNYGKIKQTIFSIAVGTKTLLRGLENYSIWVLNIENVLEMNYQKYIKRVSGSSTRFVYDLNVTDEMLSDEVHAKYILSNKEINFYAYTCFEIWNILKESYRKSRDESIEDIKEKIRKN
ncbi:hypothetical protein H8356DRAFT_1434774 [Neocallimastix lanati (nom. inval.)]|nr:hypothetical protein H8356DRAFT_1434774 [Neocallimastix sp. JGI-2020a]